MNDEAEPQASCGADAPVLVYAAETVLTMPPDATLLAAARELNDDQVGIVVIGSEGDARAVLSERDVVRAVAEGRDPAATRADAVASATLVWADSAATVCEVAELMMERYVRHVLLEEDGRLVGIVSARDLLGAYTMATSSPGAPADATSDHRRSVT